MANTYTKIALVSVGAGGSSTISFSSIPATYTDLVVKLSVRTNRANVGDDFAINFNGSAASFSGKQLAGSGSVAFSQNAIGSGTGIAIVDGGNDTASTFSNLEVYIPNYAGSTNKSLSVDGVEENNAAAAYSMLSANLWSNTAAITSISFASLNSATIQQYSTATLYGIKNS